METMFYSTLRRARVLLLISVLAAAVVPVLGAVSLLTSYPDFQMQSILRLIPLLFLLIGLYLYEKQTGSVTKVLLLAAFPIRLLLDAPQLRYIAGRGALEIAYRLLPVLACVACLVFLLLRRETLTRAQILVSVASISAIGAALLSAYYNAVYLLDEVGFYPGFSQVHFVGSQLGILISDALFFLLLSIFIGDMRQKPE